MATTETKDLVGGRYIPTAIYFDDSDCVEYVREDTFCVYERIDEFLTLIFDETKITLVGFKLKGFKNHFHTQLQQLLKLNDDQFVVLVPLIERFYTELGNRAFDDERRTAAYKAALKLAANDNVKLYGTEFRRAA